MMGCERPLNHVLWMALSLRPDNLPEVMAKEEPLKPKNSRLAVLPLLMVSVFLLGTKECQEDYEFGSQTKVVATGTPTATPDEDGTATPTPTPTATGTVAPSATAIAATPTAAPAVERAALRTDGGSFLQGLAELAKRDEDAGAGSDARSSSASTDAGEGPANPYAAVGAAQNWLGRAFQRDVKDTDNDGFSDWLEESFGTNPKDSRSIPPAPVTRLKGDALLESDGDGQLNAVEAAAGTDPRNPRSRVALGVAGIDSDGDTVPDAVERRFGSDAKLFDSDRDGASDAQELAIGSDPLNRDSDGDGILDGKEVEFGSDPVLAEASAGPSDR
jgi:hypothetical protein